jgi:TPR repeat protein
MAITFPRILLLGVILAVTLSGTVVAAADKKPVILGKESMGRMLVAAASPAPKNLPVEVTACDSIASNPLDEGRVMPGSYTIDAPDEAIATCRVALAAHPESPRLEYQLGYAFYKAGRLDEAVPYYVQAAEKGWRASLVAITFRISDGSAVAPESFAETVLHSLVNQGSAHASYALGERMIDAMKGQEQVKEQNKIEALRLLESAAEKGHSGAFDRLGKLYLEGRLVPKDQAKAVACYKAGVEKGDPDAMANLGYLFDTGIGVEKNVAEALRWTRLAASLGSTLAMRNLADMYENGEGVLQDVNQALHLYRRVADTRDPDGYADLAMVDLGRLYTEGKKVGKDLPQAASWYKKAAALGNEEAKKALARPEFAPYR